MNSEAVPPLPRSPGGPHHFFDAAGVPFDETGLPHLIDRGGWASAKELAWATLAAVDNHSQQRRLLDDLTILAIRRLPPLPA